MKETYYVYCLIGNEEEIFYVGISCRLESRIAYHRTNYSDDLKCNILQKLICNRKKALLIEKEWIKKYIETGHPLINKIHSNSDISASVRISAILVKKLKLHAIDHGGTIRSILEDGAKMYLEKANY